MTVIYAVIPARGGSKGLPNKNIRLLGGRPLISYGIEFANRLPGVSRVLCSTESEEYAAIARKYGAEVPFLRSASAAADHAMEQDILLDIRTMLAAAGIAEPDLMVWLRPTYVFRSLTDVQRCMHALVSDPTLTAARTVTRAENRLYGIGEDQLLSPAFADNGKSMMRRQDMQKAYKVFSTDVFRFKGNSFGADFLGKRVFAVETAGMCGLDIDDLFDFELVRSLVENMPEAVNEYL